VDVDVDVDVDVVISGTIGQLNLRSAR